MARQVLPIVGAVVGAYFGGPQGAQIGYAIGSLVGNAVDPLVLKAPNIGDSRVQTSAEVFRPIYFGTACGAGNIIMAGPDIKRTHETSQGKGGGPVQEETRIYKTFAIAIGDGWKGPIIGVSRIWENEKLVFDTRPESQMVAESAKFAQQFTLYTGTETQMPDEALEAIPAQFGGGAGNVSAFRGLAYIVFNQKDITTWMSIPQYRFEVVTDGSASPAVGTILVRGIGTDAAYWKPSPDGLDWSAPWVQSSHLRISSRLLASRSAYIADNNFLSPAYMDNPANNFQAGSGDTQSTTGGAKIGDYSPEYDRLLIPRGLNGGLLSSYDGGQTWDHIFPGMTSSLIIWHSASQFWYSYSLYNRRAVYTQQGLPYWSVPIETGISAAESLCGCGRGPTVLIGGKNPDVNEARIAEIAFTSVSYPPLADTTGTSITFVRHGSSIHIGSITVAVLATGEILYRPDGGSSFLKSSFTFPATPGGLDFNGNVFILAGGAGGFDDDGYVYTSVDGDNWTERYVEDIGGNSFSALVSLALSGGQVDRAPILLSEAVERIHELSGQSLTKVDTSGIAGRELGGFILSGDYTGQASIGMLASIFQFDSPEYDKQIHHRFRGQPVVRTITEDDLVDEPDEGLREDQIEFPRKLHLEAQNTASGYAPAKETSERESSDVRVVGELSVSAPVMFAGTADEQAGDQARTTSILHKVSWEKARGKREFVVPEKFLTDVPGDAYLVSIRGRLDRMTIDRQNYVDGVLRLEMSYDRASAYVSNRAGNTPSEQTPPPSTIVGVTSLMVLDLPGKIDAEDLNTALRTIAMGPSTDAWYGAEAQEQPPAGGEFSRIARVSSGAVMGTVQADIAQASEHYTDTTNRVLLQLDLPSYSERVQGLTEAQFLSEGGAFALRNADGDVEVLQYLDVDDLGDGLLELSTLMRGRLNTGTFAFPAGSRFVLLSTTTVAATPSAYVGQTVTHRAISYGETAETATTDIIEVEGNSAKEWPVANVLLDRDGDTINVTIVPRHRFGTELNPIRSVNWTNYLIEFRDSLDQVETVSSIAATLSFDASAMTFPVEVTAWQVNRFPWGTSEPVTEEIA